MQWYHWIMIVVIIVHVWIMIKTIRDDFKEKD
jgi:hypothetical protein